MPGPAARLRGMCGAWPIAPASAWAPPARSLKRWAFLGAASNVPTGIQPGHRACPCSLVTPRLSFPLSATQAPGFLVAGVCVPSLPAGAVSCLTLPRAQRYTDRYLEPRGLAGGPVGRPKIRHPPPSGPGVPRSLHGNSAFRRRPATTCRPDRSLRNYQCGRRPGWRLGFGQTTGTSAAGNPNGVGGPRTTRPRRVQPFALLIRARPLAQAGQGDQSLLTDGPKARRRNSYYKNGCPPTEGTKRSSERSALKKTHITSQRHPWRPAPAIIEAPNSGGGGPVAGAWLSRGPTHHTTVDRWPGSSFTARASPRPFLHAPSSKACGNAQGLIGTRGAVTSTRPRNPSLPQPEPNNSSLPPEPRRRSTVCGSSITARPGEPKAR